MPFTHLHLHTEYSLLDGANRIRLLPERIRELGMDSCAITDHGVMYGVVDFYQACRAAGIKAIIGCEVYVAENGLRNKSGLLDKRMSHLVLLAENQTGLQNLHKLVSTAFIEGFYYRPRIDFELLSRHKEGLIALSACMNGAVAQKVLINDEAGALETALRYRDLFGTDNYYLEVQANGMLEQRKVNAALRELSDQTGIPLVATADCHYMRREDARAHDILLCIQTGKRVSDQDRMRMGTDQLYVKSPEEMARDLPDFADAIENTERIAARCHVELDMSTIHLPAFAVPDGSPSEEFLRNLSRSELAKKLEISRDPGHSAEEYAARLESELEIILRMGYADYYLIVWDFIRFAKEREIMVGPGRGSGPASLVAYVLGITSLDPLRYDLPFERFLNPERVSLPDFDSDFCYERRSEVIDYVTELYGQERVAQVITFGTLAPKACVRDVARALDIPYADTDRIAKMIPNDLNMTLRKALEQSPEFKAAYENEPQTQEVIDTALLFEGMPRHASTHAAGVVIASQPLDELVPLSKNEDAVVIQYAKDNIEKLGLLKFDFLGLRTLTVLRDTRDMVKEKYGVEIDFERMTFDESAVYEMISAGDTAGVFQLESSGMTSFMTQLKPSSLEDIIAGVALFRPGPMAEIPRYVAARHNPKLIRYDHPLLEPILNVTYGVSVYQEQVMRIMRDLAGFSMGQSDNVRRAMSKKKPELFAAYRKLFIYGGEDENGKVVDGALQRGVPEAVAAKIFADIEVFSGYAFNKAHAACYAVVAYQTGWLKLHYPTEFMAAMLNSFLGNLGQAASYANAARQMGIKILPPDVNHSAVKFRPEGDKAIRFALGAVKNVGQGILQDLVEEREVNGRFTSFGDFLRRAHGIRMNKKAVESLIRASALDGFAVPRNRLLAVFELYLNRLNSAKTDIMSGQQSFFELGMLEDRPEEPDYPELPELAPMQLFTMEQEMLGLYVSGHPLDEYRDFLDGLGLFNAAEMKAVHEGDAPLPQEQNFDGRSVVMAALLLSVDKKITKRGENMAILQCEDLYARYEAIVFAQALRECTEALNTGAVFLLSGNLVMRDDDSAPKLVVRQIVPCSEQGYTRLKRYQRNAGVSAGRSASAERVPQEAQHSPSGPKPPPLPEIGVTQTRPSEALGLEIYYPGEIKDAGYKILTNTLAYFHGTTPVRLKFAAEGEARYLPQACWVDLAPDLLAILHARYGKNALRLFPLASDHSVVER